MPRSESLHAQSLHDLASQSAQQGTRRRRQLREGYADDDTDEDRTWCALVSSSALKGTKVTSSNASTRMGSRTASQSVAGSQGSSSTAICADTSCGPIATLTTPRLQLLPSPALFVLDRLAHLRDPFAAKVELFPGEWPLLPMFCHGVLTVPMDSTRTRWDRDTDPVGFLLQMPSELGLLSPFKRP